MENSELNDILYKYKAQPVGHGYIDIIVSRDNYEGFISALVRNSYIIRSISWWEWCPKDKESEYGLGGPGSYYFDGWFSELSIEVDNLDYNTALKNEAIIKCIIDKIESKIISFPNEKVSFKENDWLIPAIWLDVPEDWRNKYCD